MQTDRSKGQEVFPKITEFAAAMSPGDLQARSKWSTAQEPEQGFAVPLFHEDAYICTENFMCLCIEVRTCLRTYVCMYACLFVWRTVRMHAFRYLCNHACKHACMSVLLHACINVTMHACMHACIVLY